nr:phosphotransferase [Limobrevibacterium gyesilva]
MSRAASYGPGHAGVQRIETHCSIVFLVGDRAYKLKRAIRYASLDYTTRELRAAACAAELVLNRRTAPALYLGVRSITRGTGGDLVFDGAGPALDHVVVMQRFEQADLFDHMLDGGRLTRVLMEALGREVARFHLAAQVTPGFGGRDAVRRVIAENERELARVAEVLDGAAVGALGSHSAARLDTLADLLERRRAEGKVRRCHGDLRLANICLHAGRPTLFDCIEFSDEIGCIDVLHDLAFLLMDLELRGRGDLGNAVFNAYADIAPETEGLRALPLFLALRAATRSYALAGSARRQASADRAAAVLALARRHIDAGLDFLAPRRPVLAVLGGDAAARAELAPLLAALPRPAPGARLLHLAGDGDAVWDAAAAVLAAGCSVLVEGELREHGERCAAAAAMARLAAASIGFWCTTPPARLDQARWHVLDASRGALAAATRAAPLFAALEWPS